jgi:hypothetical protein
LSYLQGQTVQLTATFERAVDPTADPVVWTPFDPASVGFNYTPQDSPTVRITFPDGRITNPATGVFVAVLTLDIPGTTTYRFSGTGTGASGAIHVDADPNY